MSSLDNKEFIRRYLDTINRKPKPESIVSLYVVEQELKDHIAAAEEAPFDVPIFLTYRNSGEKIVDH